MKKRKTDTYKAGIVIGLFLLIIILSVVFIKQYKQLGVTIENERITYVSEIKEQLIENINAEKKQQMLLVEMYAQTLLALNPSDFEDAKNILSNYNSLIKDKGDMILLVDQSGEIYTLKGETRSISDSQMIQQIVADRAEVFSYAQINMNEEFWIYGRPMDKLQIQDKVICGIINARSTQNTGNSMSTSIFNDKAFAYITSKEGNILLYPTAANDMGYNIFSTLERQKVDAKELEVIQKDFEMGNEGQKFLNFSDNKWILDYSSSIYDDWIVAVLMPMTVTAADTYRMMRATLAAVLLWVGNMMLFLTYVFSNLYTREIDRKRMIKEGQLKLEMSQKIADSKNQFLAKMSHDIRTPLNAILGLLQITAEKVKGQKEVEINLTKAKKSADYLLSILNDILDMSKIESGKMVLNRKPINIPLLVESLVNIVESQIADKGIHFIFAKEGTCAAAYLGDGLRISQILMNLFSNAIKFTSRGGSITLCMSVYPEEGDFDRIVFSVSDTGIGMSEEYRQRVFQPFEQEDASVALNYGGSGLGLSIVKNLIELMEGEIRVESRKGEGSSFIISFVLEKTQQMADEEALGVGEADCSELKGKKVLLVEDNELNAEIAYELLTHNLGVAVAIAENGQEAVDKFVQSSPGTFDVILMDIRMPVMNGLEAAKAIRLSNHIQADIIPIIAMSANAYEEDISLSMEAGMNAHLSKPIDLVKIQFTLKKYLLQSLEVDRKV